MKLFFGDDYRITQWAAWVLSHCHDLQPNLILPYVDQLISNLNTNPDVAIKRNTVRILQNVALTEDQMGPLADHCFKYLKDANEAIAVKVFSMTILANITKIFPELKDEIVSNISNQFPFSTAAFKSRGSKVIKQLSRL